MSNILTNLLHYWQKYPLSALGFAFVIGIFVINSIRRIRGRNKPRPPTSAATRMVQIILVVLIFIIMGATFVVMLPIFLPSQ